MNVPRCVCQLAYKANHDLKTLCIAIKLNKPNLLTYYMYVATSVGS